MAVVVLPVPPFWLQIPIIFPIYVSIEIYMKYLISPRNPLRRNMSEANKPYGFYHRKMQLISPISRETIREAIKDLLSSKISREIFPFHLYL